MVWSTEFEQGEYVGGVDYISEEELTKDNDNIYSPV